MTKYRIVRRVNDTEHYVNKDYLYFAQKKLFNLFWVDCRTFSCSAGHGYEKGAETPSHSQELVEKYIEHILPKVNEPRQTVVKTYD